MAVQARLTARIREERGKGAARQLRAAGRVPAVLYGHGEETRALSLDAHELSRLFSKISIENTLLTLTLEGDGASTGELKALVREVQVSPSRGDVLHVDFYQVHAGERVHVEVPIRLVGTPEGVKTGGILQQPLTDLAIRCLADQIPDFVELDVSALDIGDARHVSDLQLPAGVIAEADADRVVCTVLAPTVAALEEPAAEEAPGVGGEVEPELIRRRPSEEDMPPATGD